MWGLDISNILQWTEVVVDDGENCCDKSPSTMIHCVKQPRMNFGSVWVRLVTKMPPTLCITSRYPRPNRCIHDNGGEFIGWEFQQKLQQHGIIDVPTTSRNPQGNSICERMHQTVAQVLRTTKRINPPQTEEQAIQLVKDALATTVYATRASVSSALNTSPGNLVFRRDMFLDLPLQADLVLIRDRRQQLIDDNLRWQNAKRREHYYDIGQEVLIKALDPRKLDPRAHGPYTIQRVYQNGTIDVARNANVVERLNIRRVIPFKRWWV